MFERWQEFLSKRTGIVLPKSKRYLVENRLHPLLRRYEQESMEGLYDLLHSRGNEELAQEVIELLTTHETFFFRDPGGFVVLRHAFNQFLKDNPPHKKAVFKVWSAACSTGQEVYSIAMALFPLMKGRITFEVLGSDIAKFTVANARTGQYRDLRGGINETQVRQFFVQHTDYWEVHRKLRPHVSFRVSNLMDNRGIPKDFDIIMLRNVAIYFDPVIRAELFENVAKHLKPDGKLILGGTESMIGIKNKYKRETFMGAPFYKYDGTKVTYI